MGASSNKEPNPSATAVVLTTRVHCCWIRYNDRAVAKRNRKKQAVSPVVLRAGPGPGRWDRAWPYLALAILAFLVYSNALANGFAADDDSQLLNNPLVVNYREIPRIFGQDIWAFS